MAFVRGALLRWLARLLDGVAVLTLGYGALLGLWVAARALFGDRWWWLFALNALAVYLFVPLPLALLAALAVRSRAVLLAASGALALFLWLYGALLLPPWPAAPPPGPRLRVMTYNMYGLVDHPAGVVAAIRRSRADIVTIQELNRSAAAQIQRDLRGLYPYQALVPKGGAFGMGVISKLPLRPSSMPPPAEVWMPPVQLLTVDVAGRPVTLIHIHPWATQPGWPAAMEESVRYREGQIAWLVEALARQPGPLLMPVDFNATDQHATYAMVRRTMGDAWRAAGWGAGLTFPSPSPTSLRVAGVPLPWLMRIDYVFYSRHWHPLRAELGPWDGVSDHRPVIADLVLLE